jgi:hypothetical protein
MSFAVGNAPGSAPPVTVEDGYLGVGTTKSKSERCAR